MPAPVTPLTLNLTAPAMKCTAVLTPASLIGVLVPDGAPRVNLRVQIDKRTVTASVAAKSVRRAILAIGEFGPDGTALLLQGKLGVHAQPLEIFDCNGTGQRVTPARMVSGSIG
jgi:hypothetical protein